MIVHGDDRPDLVLLADARELLARAKNAVSRGDSPARDKADGKRELRESGTFNAFAVAIPRVLRRRVHFPELRRHQLV